MQRAFVAALLAWAVAGLAWADSIELSDGRKFNGSMSRTGDVMTIKTDDGKTVTVKPSQIAKVTLTGNTTPEEAAAAEWARINQQAKTADDLELVIVSLKRFLEKYPTFKPSDDARAALANYEKIVQEDPVKFRGRWLARAQVDGLKAQWTQAAGQATEQYRAGRLKEALDSAMKAIAADSQNPDALTIAGLAAYRNSNLPGSRNYFTALAAADPTSVLAENNLAVIFFMQKNPAGGLQHYAKALQIAPDSRVLLDNIAEALNAYLAGRGDKNGMAYKSLAKQYEPAESRMEETLGKLGFVRWGSTWVTRDKHARLAQYQEDIRRQMGELDTQYATAQKSLASLDAQIRQAATDADGYARAVAFNDQQIMIGVQSRLDTSYYASLRDAAAQNYDRMVRFRAQLETQRDQLTAAARDFFAQADRVRTAASSGGLAGQFTGTQRILDLDDVSNPSAPAAVPDPVALPDLKPPPLVINQPPAPAPPPLVVPATLVPVPVVPAR
jgi:hypothetical protein